MQTITPSKRHAWIDRTDNDWDELIPLCSKAAKAGKRGKNALFQLFSRGLGTYRDEWVYDTDPSVLASKVRYLIDVYERARMNDASGDFDTIKWDRELDKYRQRRIPIQFRYDSILSAAFRPFVRRHLYFDKHLNGMTYQLPDMFRSIEEDMAIAFLGIASSHELAVQAVNNVCDLGFLKQGNGGTQCVSRYRYTSSGERVDNITDWGLRRFKAHYGADRKRPITKDAIFHYVYGVLHDPVYRETYAINLKRDLPRIPFYPDFWQWAAWGERLMDLHINYESVEPWPLERLDVPDEKAREADVAPKTILKADTDNGIIRLDAETTLSGVPAAAWDYRLGNRSALHWILDQYKEKTPRDPTIREKFNTYRFADYKEQVADLLMRVTRVSVETVAIVEAMRAARRD